MKTNPSHVTFLYKGYILMVACLISISSIATPPDYDFRNSVLLSGTALQLNCKYRFPNVRTGTDAIVTVATFSGGATLSQIDGPTGYAEAFQPVITVPANRNGYVEFLIQFVTAGTQTALIMPQISSTSLDIDGTLSASNGNVFEYDMVSLNSVSSVYNYDMSSTELNMNSSAGWVTGTNATGNNYSGVDTSAKNVMFTVINYSSSSFRVRMGTDNRSTSSTTRNKSIYFANFGYANGLLAKNSLIQFTGIYKNDYVSLEWQIEKSAEIQKIVVERSMTGNQFTAIQNFEHGEAASKTNFQLSDYAALHDKMYYRLKIILLNGTVNYSKIITMLSPTKSLLTLQAYVNGSGAAPSVIINSPIKTEGTLMLVDLMGNIKLKTAVTVNKGVNNIKLNSVNLSNQGYHVVVLQTGKTIYTNKFLGKTL